MKKQHFFKIAAFLLLPFLLISCTNWFGIAGSGKIVTENRNVINFHSVEILSSADVEIVKGDSFNIEVSDYENIIRYLSLKVVANSLIISVDPSAMLLINSKAKVMITMPDTLKSLSITGSGNMKINSAFKDIEQMTITGSGDIDVTQNLSIGSITANIFGSGNIYAKGNAEFVTAKITGSGDIDFSNLIAHDSNCTISGSGNINVNIINELTAKITGSGNINYYGNPKTVNSSTTGSGGVIKKN